MNKTTVTGFCALEQTDTEHDLSLDGTGEIVLTCTSNIGTNDEPVTCGRFIKLPAGTDIDGIQAYLAKHRTDNYGQISLDAAEAERVRILNALNPDN